MIPKTIARFANSQFVAWIAVNLPLLFVSYLHVALASVGTPLGRSRLDFSLRASIRAAHHRPETHQRPLAWLLRQVPAVSNTISKIYAKSTGL